MKLAPRVKVVRKPSTMPFWNNLPVWAVVEAALGFCAPWNGILSLLAEKDRKENKWRVST